MADFSLFLPTLLRFEGGFTHDPIDPGGASNKGITLQTFAACAPTLLGLQPTLECLKNLTDHQAGLIYKSLYWDKICGDQIPSQLLASLLCDFYVNAGSHAVKSLQTTLNQTSRANLAVDGILGPASLHALLSADQALLYRHLKENRIAYYHNLVQHQPTLARFLAGWLNRVNSFPEA
jgi:lysozyme family protein